MAGGTVRLAGETDDIPVPCFVTSRCAYHVNEAKQLFQLNYAVRNITESNNATTVFFSVAGRFTSRLFPTKSIVLQPSMAFDLEVPHNLLLTHSRTIPISLGFI